MLKKFLKLVEVATNQVATFSLYKVIKTKIEKEVRMKMLLVAIPIAIATALSGLWLARRKTKLKEVRARQ